MNDFLTYEIRRLQRLEVKSANALNLVTRTISKLKASNEQIAQSKGRIAEYIAGLESQSQALSSLESKNTRIIENFSRLIEG